MTERKGGRDLKLDDVLPKFYPPRPGVVVVDLDQAIQDAETLADPKLKVTSGEKGTVLVEQTVGDQINSITLTKVDGDFFITSFEYKIEGVMPVRYDYLYRERFLFQKVLREKGEVIFIDTYKSSQFLLPNGQEITVWNMRRLYSKKSQENHGREADELRFEDLFTHFNPATLASSGLGIYVYDSYLPERDWEKPFEKDIKEGDTFTRLIKRVPGIPGKNIKAEMEVVGSGAGMRVKPLSVELVAS